MSWFFVHCCAIHPLGCICSRQCAAGSRDPNNGFVAHGIVQSKEAELEWRLLCPDGLPVALVAPESRVKEWQKKAAQLALNGSLIGVFSDAAKAATWTRSKSMTARMQRVFVQTQ